MTEPVPRAKLLPIEPSALIPHPIALQRKKIALPLPSGGRAAILDLFAAL